MYLQVPLIPRHVDGVLRVIGPGRISTPMQDLASIDAGQQDSENWLRSVYTSPYEFIRVGEQASGWRVDRPSMEVARNMLLAGELDLVLVGEFRELYRNPKLQWGFIQDCLDNDTRLIARWDGIDTANDDWENAMHIACLRHGLAVPETRRRVKRKATETFAKGGMVMKVRYGYRKLSVDEAASGAFGPKGLRIAKLTECTPTFKELRRRILAGYTDVMAADWLMEDGVSPGPYVTSGKWSGQLVCDLLTDPILSGQREFRKTISKIVYGNGKHRAVHNPSPLQDALSPELGFFTVPEHEELLRHFCQRKAKKRALDYSRRMEREGLTDPYRVLTAAPAAASRWKPHRGKPTDDPSDLLADPVG